MATKKTIYVPDADETVWERFEELTKESLAQSVGRLVRREVERLETLNQYAGELEKIVIEVSTADENNILDGDYKKVAFTGKWLVENDYGYSVALTAKNQIFVYYRDIEVSFYKEPYPNFASLEQDEKIPADLKHVVADALNEDYEEFLDI